MSHTWVRGRAAHYRGLGPFQHSRGIEQRSKRLAEGKANDAPDQAGDGLVVVSRRGDIDVAKLKSGAEVDARGSRRKRDDPVHHRVYHLRRTMAISTHTWARMRAQQFIYMYVYICGGGGGCAVERWSTHARNRREGERAKRKEPQER